MSCCGSLFVNLGGAPIADGFLKTDAALTTTMQVVKDNAGNSSLFQLATNKAQFFLSSAASVKFCDGGNFLDFSDSAAGYIRYGLNAAIGIKFGGGNSTVLFGAGAANPILLANSASVDIGISTITNNGVLTVKGAGANIQSWRNSSNVEVGFINNTGTLSLNGNISCGLVSFQGIGLIAPISDGIIRLSNNAVNGFDRLQFGGTSASFPAIKRNGINLEVKTADDTSYGGITAGRSTQKTLEVLEVSGAMGLGFFNTPAINQPITGGASATYASVSGSEIKENDTFDGYTVGGVVKALRNLGLLA